MFLFCCLCCVCCFVFVVAQHKTNKHIQQNNTQTPAKQNTVMFVFVFLYAFCVFLNCVAGFVVFLVVSDWCCNFCVVFKQQQHTNTQHCVVVCVCAFSKLCVCFVVLCLQKHTQQHTQHVFVYVYSCFPRGFDLFMFLCVFVVFQWNTQKQQLCFWVVLSVCCLHVPNCAMFCIVVVFVLCVCFMFFEHHSKTTKNNCVFVCFCVCLCCVCVCVFSMFS